MGIPGADESEDFIQDANYSVLKEAVHCGVTMTCNTGDSNMEAVTAKWNYWTTEAVSKDASMMQDLKNVMMWQNYALANSNAMDGLNETSQIKDVRTWYDKCIDSNIGSVGSAYTGSSCDVYKRCQETIK